MSKTNKYLGPTGLTELINLIQADFQKKQDWTQFTEMPDATLYSGKVVQYTGISNNAYTKGHFYYSNGLAWVYIAICDAVEVCAVLPSWDEASAGLIYYVTSESACYIKGSETDEWLNIAGGESTSFEIVDELPAWEAADPKIIYMVPAAANNSTESDDSSEIDSGSVIANPGLVVGGYSSETDDTATAEDLTVTGYIKDATTPGKFYQLGGSTEPAFELVTTLPDWSDANSDALYLVIDGTKITGYVKDVNTEDQFYVLGETVEPDPAFEVVDELPTYADADPDVLYLVPDDTGILSVYKKDPDTTGKFFELSGSDAITTEDIDDIFEEVFN